ncbi:CHAT domain-containing protein [Nostoc sp. KVJ3]|uniref:CHAT domain-containing protein n=1 Tax=Nostoc sp. KVJ3 TaxID=457945 RepID=UPI0022386EBC|nr:CHAT domain-containing protein [Nostoc sp. KVJ3]MCW5315510.1 CHAT domain-containing protein [Nostoc sp. KVJ3]
MLIRKTKLRTLVKILKTTALVFLGIILFINIPVLLSEQAAAKEPATEAAKLAIAGKKLYEAGQFDEAVHIWQEAANAYKLAGNEEGKTQNLINVAEAMQANGLDLKACNQILQAFNIAQPDCRQLIQDNEKDRQQSNWFQALESKPNSLNKANGLRSLGDVLQKLDRPDLSTKVLDLSLQVARQLPSPTTESAVLLSLGNAQRSLGDRIQIQQGRINKQNSSPINCGEQAKVGEETSLYQQAASLYQQAATKSISANTWVQAQLNHLRLLIEMNELAEAMVIIPQIELKVKELPTNQTTIYARINFAESLVCLNQYSAIAHADLKDIAKELVVALEQAKSLGDRRGESYALGYLGWLYEQNQQFLEALTLTQKALFSAQAIQATDMVYQWQWQLGHILKAQGDIKGAIAAYDAAIVSLQSLRLDMTAINSQIQFSFREQVEPVYRQLVESLLQTQVSSNLKSNNLQKARTTIESLQLAELENFLREPCLKSRVEIDQIVDKSDSTAAVVYPIILEKQLAIILKLPRQEELRYYATAISQEQVESTIAKLQQYLPNVSQSSQVKHLSQQVYDWLIRPLEADLKNNIETLIFVLDGSLRNIPMAALYDAQQEKYLVEKYAIALAPGLQLVEPKPLHESSKIKVLAAGVSQKRLVEGREFAALTNVKKELARIQIEIPKSEELLDSKFTKTNLQNKLQSASFSVVHLATHSQFSSNPEKTFILTWDRLLNIEDLIDLLKQKDPTGSNSIELLVLSSCETATGDRQASLGLAGIAVRAGADSTIASLWSIDDLSTSEIMNQLYQELNKGATRAKALQQAQLALLKKEKRPYFWASFILVGNWL